MERNIPSTWILPSEYDIIFVDVANEVNGTNKSAEDEHDCVEVTSRELAKRCLELIGREMFV